MLESLHGQLTFRSETPLLCWGLAGHVASQRKAGRAWDAELPSQVSVPAACASRSQGGVLLCMLCGREGLKLVAP